VEEPGNASVQYNLRVNTGNIPDNLAMAQTNLRHAEVTDHP